MLGSVLITLSTMLGAFAIVKSSEYGLFSARTVAIGGTSLALLAGFLVLESRIANPIMPLRILRLRMLMGSSLVPGCSSPACSRPSSSAPSTSSGYSATTRSIRAWRSCR